jgi:hypothetical protein
MDCGFDRARPVAVKCPEPWTVDERRQKNTLRKKAMGVFISSLKQFSFSAVNL